MWIIMDLDKHSIFSSSVVTGCRLNGCVTLWRVIHEHEFMHDLHLNLRLESNAWIFRALIENPVHEEVLQKFPNCNVHERCGVYKTLRWMNNQCHNDKLTADGLYILKVLNDLKEEMLLCIYKLANSYLFFLQFHNYGIRRQKWIHLLVVPKFAVTRELNLVSGLKFVLHYL